VTIVAATRRVTATGAFSAAAVGQTITISGMTTAANNVTGVIATKVSSDAVTLTVATTGLADETGPITAGIDGAGEEGYIIGGGPSWSATGSYTAPLDDSALNATNNVGEVYLDNALSLSCFQSLDFTLTNNLRETPCISNEFPTIGYGTPMLTGKFQKLYADLDLWRKMHDHEPISLDFGFVGQDGATGLHFTFPKVQINTDPLDLSSGKNTDIYDKVDWSAQRYTNSANETYYAMVCKA
jgi:hypothetical protein